jgi:hypothetical protein
MTPTDFQLLARHLLPTTRKNGRLPIKTLPPAIGLTQTHRLNTADQLPDVLLNMFIINH